MSATVIIARNKFSLKPIHINNVVKGIDRDFECPECSIDLVAVKGENNEHHFRHKGSLTIKCRETALHEYAKQILVESAFIETKQKGISYYSPHKEVAIGLFRSDVAAKFDQGELHFEVVVHHDFLDTAKELYYQEHKINCIRIDLSNPALLTATSAEIKYAVLEDKNNIDFIPWEKENHRTGAVDIEVQSWVVKAIFVVTSFFLVKNILFAKKKQRLRFKRR